MSARDDARGINRVLAQRVERRRAARRLLHAWLQFTPCQLEEGLAPRVELTAEGDAIVHVRLRVLAADVEKELTKAALKLPDDAGEGYA